VLEVCPASVRYHTRIWMIARTSGKPVQVYLFEIFDRASSLATGRSICQTSTS
jgi:hypothetical protein